jgi:2-(1,2-epoxy-1,2-dihydrophenyl)acetyl-CoA isomerase
MKIEIGDGPEFTDVTLTSEGSVAVLTLSRPTKLNALTLAMHRALLRAIRIVRGDANLKVLVMTGTGRAFCAGDDMKESDPRDGVAPPEAETELAWHNIVRELRAMPKPVIAAVNGIACGAGGGLALAADLRFASDDAQFADIFTKRGIAGGAYLLTQLVGTAKALELIFTGDFVPAAEALRIGLFNRVLPKAQLMRETLAFAARLAAGPSEAYGFSKWAVYQAAHLHLNEGLRTEELAKLCSLRGAEVREGITAFNDRKKASPPSSATLT